MNISESLTHAYVQKTARQADQTFQIDLNVNIFEKLSSLRIWITFIWLQRKQKNLSASHSSPFLIIESFFGLCATLNVALPYFCNFKIRSNELCSCENTLKGFSFLLESYLGG